MVEFKEKKVDEEWKQMAEAEKEMLGQKAREEAEKKLRARALPRASFANFMSGLAAQVMVSLGQLENPVSGAKEVDLEHARYSIDVIKMLKEKTKGNLSKQEDAQLDSLIYQLQMAFVQISETGAAGKAK
jgi:hypothetical protein